MRAIVSVVVLLLVGWSVGCPSQEECTTSENCPVGTVCTDAGQCSALQCTTSTQCPIGNYCDLDVGDCVRGCANDTDCLPSQNCDVAQRRCEEPRCRDTRLDCGFGMFCNENVGNCVTASSVYCQPCAFDSQCGESGANLCLAQGLDAYCGVDCAAGQECPQGYECRRISSLGVTVGYQCLTDCTVFGP